MWAVEDDEKVGIDETQRLINAGRGLADVSEYLLEREEWSTVATAVKTDYRPICANSQRRRVGDKILYRTEGGDES
jgi:hypothetical protein